MELIYDLKIHIKISFYTFFISFKDQHIWVKANLGKPFKSQHCTVGVKPHTNGKSSESDIFVVPKCGAGKINLRNIPTGKYEKALLKFLCKLTCME